MGGFFQDVSNGLEKEVTCSFLRGICFTDPTPYSVPTRQPLISQYTNIFDIYEYIRICSFFYSTVLCWL